MKRMILFIMSVLSCPMVFSEITYEDGDYHLIDYRVTEGVYIDPSLSGLGTHVELADGGWINNGTSVIVRNDGKLTVSGGKIDWSITSTDNSIVNMTGGYLEGHLNCASTATITGGSMDGVLVYITKDAHVDFINGTVRWIFELQSGASATISGGIIKAWKNSYPSIRLYQDSQLTISGGDIQGMLRSGWYSSDSALITIEGYDFAINGTPLALGQYASSYGLSGTITGNLKNGGSLDNLYELYGNSDILFTPEPATVLLFGLGAMFLRRKRMS